MSRAATGLDGQQIFVYYPCALPIYMFSLAQSLAGLNFKEN